MKPLQQQFSPVKYSVTHFGGGQTPQGVSYPGGLDLTTPSLALQAGALRACLNFEVSQSGGYARCAGYERFDGRVSPSSASYIILQFTAFTNQPAVGDTISQAVSGATGTIVAVATAPAPYIAVTQLAGTFDLTHTVTDTTTAKAIGIPVTQTVSISAQQGAIYTAAAADVYRNLIGAVPGSGAVLDVFHVIASGLDKVYAFRANVGGTAVNLYKASGTGWSQVTLYDQVQFTAGGTATAKDGDVLTQGAVTATVKRVVQASGTWSGTAAGTLVITTPAGGHFAAGAATLVGSGATVTLSGTESAITLSTGGTFEHVRANFSGQPSTLRVYGCDGVNKAYEFDPVNDIYVPITTGLTTDAPSHITFHRNYLMLSYAGSLLYSAPGAPYKWTATDGGGEIATGDAVNAMITLPGSQSTATLALFLRTNTAFLYGTDTSNFELVSFNNGIGGLPRSAQNLFDTVVLDNLGVVTLRTTLNWGNFLPSSLTKNILPFIKQERSKITCSTICRDKSHYRLFFSDGYGLFITLINQQYLGASVMQYPNPVSCVDEDDTTTGDEIIYFGSNDGNGYVYQAEVGTSFDGAAISAYITLAWDALRSPEILKRFRFASLEIQGSEYANISFGYQLGYGSSNINQPSSVNYDSGFTPAPNWDAFTWDSFAWDGQTLLPTRVDMTGTAENVAVTISSGTNYIAPYTVDSIAYHYSMRRGIRG